MVRLSVTYFGQIRQRLDTRLLQTYGLKMAKVLVIGGAGYVGGTVCAWLLDQGHSVWVLDDYSTGHREWTARLPGVQAFIDARVGDRQVVQALLERERFDCVMHFAGKAIVAESVVSPRVYYENNVNQTKELMEAMLSAGVRRLIFSSSCAVFGDPGPTVERMGEGLPKNPMNPYGATKLEVERMLEEYARDRGLQAIALRYFNAAGADFKGRVGEWHDPETHLIPLMLKAALAEKEIEVFGTDYPTPDGTAIRDYVHVWDLAEAHGAAMKRLLSLGEAGCFEVYHLGSERGYSVLEMVRACEQAIGKKIRFKACSRRSGDPARLVADASRAREVLGFRPMDGALERIFSSAWNWEGLRAQVSRKSFRAVFLDRDGTINMDPGYISDPSQMKLIPGVGKAMAQLMKAGFKLVVVSNQSGIARGVIKPEILPKIHARMEELLAPAGARIDHYELCLHRPEDDCECRKPKPKLIQDGARALGIDLAQSYMVGDKLSDILSGIQAGCKASLLVRTGHGMDTEKQLTPGQVAFIGNSLREVVRWILGQETGGL
ncbi:UDP-glucose 4-epimerase GalE [Bdellovibrionota bacterium FG-1]